MADLLVKLLIEWPWRCIKWLARGYVQVFREGDRTVRAIMLVVPAIAAVMLCGGANAALNNARRGPAVPTPRIVYVVATSAPSAIPTATPTPKPSATPAITNTPGPSRTPKPTSTPRPTASPTPTPSPIDTLELAIIRALGACNRPGVTKVGQVELVDREITIRFAIDDALFFVKEGAQEDVADILRAISEADLAYSAARIQGTFPTKDKFGNSAETVVVHAVYAKVTIDKINWKGFRYTDVWDIADWKQIHPDLR